MTDTTRCKFRLWKIAEMHGFVGKEYTFQAMYDDTIPEDRRFNKYTPSGTFTMIIDNPAVEPMLVKGADYYFDITRVPPQEADIPAERRPQP